APPTAFGWHRTRRAVRSGSSRHGCSRRAPRRRRSRRSRIPSSGRTRTEARPGTPPDHPAPPRPPSQPKHPTGVGATGRRPVEGRSTAGRLVVDRPGRCEPAFTREEATMAFILESTSIADGEPIAEVYAVAVPTPEGRAAIDGRDRSPHL